MNGNETETNITETKETQAQIKAQENNHDRAKKEKKVLRKKILSRKTLLLTFWIVILLALSGAYIKHYLGDKIFGIKGDEQNHLETGIDMMRDKNPLNVNSLNTNEHNSQNEPSLKNNEKDQNIISIEQENLEYNQKKSNEHQEKIYEIEKLQAQIATQEKLLSLQNSKLNQDLASLQAKNTKGDILYYAVRLHEIVKANKNCTFELQDVKKHLSHEAILKDALSKIESLCKNEPISWDKLQKDFVQMSISVNKQLFLKQEDASLLNKIKGKIIENVKLQKIKADEYSYKPEDLLAKASLALDNNDLDKAIIYVKQLPDGFKEHAVIWLKNAEDYDLLHNATQQIFDFAIENYR